MKHTEEQIKKRANDRGGFCERRCQQWLRPGEGRMFYRSEQAIEIGGSDVDVPNVQTGWILECLDRKKCDHRVEQIISGELIEQPAPQHPENWSLDDTWALYGLQNEGENE